MYDDISASPTPNDPTAEPSANRGPAASRSDREADRDGPGRVESDRQRDGIDPPEGDEDDRTESDEGCDPEPMEYRLERLRLLRTVVTLAVVVARLIRSL